MIIQTTILCLSNRFTQESFFISLGKEKDGDKQRSKTVGDVSCWFSRKWKQVTFLYFHYLLWLEILTDISWGLLNYGKIYTKKPTLGLNYLGNILYRLQFVCQIDFLDCAHCSLYVTHPMHKTNDWNPSINVVLRPFFIANPPWMTKHPLQKRWGIFENMKLWWFINENIVL